MTATSLICNLIADSNFDKGYWMSMLENDHHGIYVKEDGPLAIFNYGINANFNDPFVREARGIIINTETAEVVCWPFTKFGKYDEPCADKIDWTTARVQEKLDGSIIKLWFNALTNEWCFSTNSTINAKDALMSNYASSAYMVSFQEMIEKADNFHLIDYSILDKTKTYILELCGPGNRVIVPYDEYTLYHTGTRSNLTGQEFNDWIGIQKPKEYGLHNLDECIDYVSNVFNTNEDGRIGNCENEGFVVVDGHWHRNKIKSPIYMQLHCVLNNSYIGKKILVDLLFRRKIDVQSICDNYPSLAPAFKWYDYQVERFKYEASTLVDVTKRINDLVGGDRKRVALRIKDHKLNPIGFMALSHMDATIDELYDMFGMVKITKWIPDYPKSHFGIMFNGLYTEEGMVPRE